jgi:hypothetical protein
VTQRRHNRLPRDLTTIVAELMERVDKLETVRRLGTSSVDSGQLVLNGGDLVVKNNAGQIVLRIISGDTPEVRMTPTGGDTNYRATSLAWESETLGTIWQAGVQDETGEQDGGKLLLMQSGAYLSNQPKVGDEAYLSIGALGDWHDTYYFKGKWPNNVILDGKEAVAMGTVNVAAGVSSTTVTYATPFTGTPIVVYSLLNSAGAVTHSLTASSASAFTVAWSGTLAKTLNWVAFRI